MHAALRRGVTAIPTFDQGNFSDREITMSSRIIRVVTRASDGDLRTREFNEFEALESLHEQVGIDDCSTDLELRGMPVYRGLIGPIPEGKTAVRYESPEVFEALTKVWTKQKAKRRRRRTAKEMQEAAAAEAAAAAAAPEAAVKSSPPAPKFRFGSVTHTPTPSQTMASN